MQYANWFKNNAIKIGPSIFSGLIAFCTPGVFAEELLVGKSCPIKFDNTEIGTLVVSKPWYHASRQSAAYQAMDDATGIGVEIHFFANEEGDVRYTNLPNCDRYRLLQIRDTNARLGSQEPPLQLDIPAGNESPYYDNYPLEFGHGTHKTPEDDLDKPWNGRPIRSSTVGIYDTPYLTDAYGIEGKNMTVSFETCAVCERDHTVDTILGCVTWGYEREYMGGQTGWAEPEANQNECLSTPTDNLYFVMKRSELLAYYLQP